jgi:hypothetical protein
MKLSYIFVFIIVLLGYSDIVSADSMYCGSKLISSGDAKAEVLIKCGEPLLKERVGEKTMHKRYFDSIVSSTVSIEKWTYDMGYGHFLRILTFEGNTLINIELGDKP